MEEMLVRRPLVAQPLVLPVFHEASGPLDPFSARLQAREERGVGCYRHDTTSRRRGAEFVGSAIIDHRPAYAPRATEVPMTMTANYTEHDIAVDDMTLHYQEWGDAGSPPVLMLHGFGLSGHMFDEFATRVASRYHLFAVDQRGHGDSSWAEDGDYSRDSFVADVEAVRAKLGLDEFILVGHSMGGLNAVTYAAEHPERVRALVLVDVGPEAAKEGVDNIARFTRGPDNLEFEQFVEMAHRFNPRRDIENIRERMRTRLKPTDDGKWTWKFDKRFREGGDGLRVGSQMSADETWQIFRSVSAPTLLVRGAESDVLTPEVAERAVREMPRARLEVVPNAGHSVPGDNPDGFTRVVEGFLADLEAGIFSPTASTEPPPLDVALARHRMGRKRGSLAGLVVVGFGAAVVFFGARYVIGRRRAASSSKGTPVSGKDRARADLAIAQRRAVDLIAELSAASRQTMGQARDALSDAQMERARQAAADVLGALENRAKDVPALAATGTAARERAIRGKEASRRTGEVAMKVALAVIPAIIANAKRKSKKSPTK